jgi:hypothetical protein
MDGHKPKSWRGWSEFAKEIGIIVIGVLIALGAQQVVEAINRRDEVAEARAALKREVRYDLTNAAISAREDACLRRVLLLWEDYASGGPKPPLLGGVYVGLHSTTWDIAKTGAVTHMPLDERVAFASFYANVANQALLVQIEREFSRHLAGYARLPKLSPQESDEFLRELPGMEGTLRAKIVNYAGLFELGRVLGERPEVVKNDLTDRIDKLCALAATVKAPAQP